VLLGISKDSYYNSKSPQEALEVKYSALRPKLSKIIEKDPGYGYPRLKKALSERYGEIVNHKLLLKLLTLWGLTLKRKIRKNKRSWIKRILDYLKSRANLLREAVVSSCFQAVVSDITEIVYKGGRAYLCVHLDHFGKMVYGWHLQLSPDSNLVIKSFKQARAKLMRLGIRSLKKIIFHQDRGTQYTSTDYITTVLETGGYLSYSKRGEPGDNAVNEAFFSRLKEERRDELYEAKTFEELKRLIKKIIDYYHNERYHTSIGNQTPAEFTLAQAGNTL